MATVILRFHLSIPNTQYWFNTGPRHVCDAGPELKDWINVFLLSNLENKGWRRSGHGSGHRGAQFTLLAMNGESPDMSTIESTLDPIIGLVPCKQKGSICTLGHINMCDI